MSTKKKKFNISDLEAQFGKITVGRFLKAWRMSVGMSQKKFAGAIGISAANLCDIEKGRKGVGIARACEIAKIIGYSPTALIQLAIEDQVRAAGIKCSVEIKRLVA